MRTLCVLLCLSLVPLFAAEVLPPPQPRGLDGDVAALRAAIEDLIATYGEKYPLGQAYLDELNELPKQEHPNTLQRFHMLKRKALLANPALEGLQILCVKRKWAQKGVAPGNLALLGIPSNHECQASLPVSGFDNEIAMFGIRTMNRMAGTCWICPKTGLFAAALF